MSIKGEDAWICNQRNEIIENKISDMNGKVLWILENCTLSKI